MSGADDHYDVDDEYREGCQIGGRNQLRIISYELRINEITYRKEGSAWLSNSKKS